ncbi:MAG: hypothetical protein LBD17_04170 [Endomicrobium sp.]|jgi:hypothetical protein|nr:hypothetical protein [Endomicrobium sp.]
MLQFSDRVKSFFNQNDLSKLKLKLELIPNYPEGESPENPTLDISDDLIIDKNISISRQLDVKDYATWQASTLNLTLSNQHNKYFQNKRNGYFEIANIYGSEVHLSFYLSGYPEDNYRLFTGYIFESPKYRPDGGVVEIRLIDAIKKLQSISAEDIANVFTDEQCTTTDPNRLIFYTQNNYVGFIDVLKKGNLTDFVILKEGVDYKLSDLDSINKCKITLTVQPGQNDNIYATYRQWITKISTDLTTTRSPNLDDIPKLSLDHINWDNSKRDIEPILFTNNVEVSQNCLSYILAGIQDTNPFKFQSTNWGYSDFSMTTMELPGYDDHMAYDIRVSGSGTTNKIYFKADNFFYRCLCGIFTDTTFSVGFCFRVIPNDFNPTSMADYVFYYCDNGALTEFGRTTLPQLAYDYYRLEYNNTNIAFYTGNDKDKVNILIGSTLNPLLTMKAFGMKRIEDYPVGEKLEDISFSTGFRNYLFDGKKRLPFAEFEFSISDQNMLSLSRIDIPFIFPQQQPSNVKIATALNSNSSLSEFTDYIPNSSLEGKINRYIVLRIWGDETTNFPSYNQDFFNTPTLYYYINQTIPVNVLNFKNMNIYSALQAVSSLSSYTLGIKNDETVFLKPNTDINIVKEISDDKIIKVDSIVDQFDRLKNKVTMKMLDYQVTQSDNSTIQLYGEKAYTVSSTNLTESSNVNLPYAIVPTVLNNLKTVLTEISLTIILDLSLELNDYIKIWHEPNVYDSKRYTDYTNFFESYTNGIFGFISKIQNDLKNKTTKISLMVDFSQQIPPSPEAKSFKYNIKSSFDNEI